MNKVENPITNNLKKELHRFGDGLQALYNTVEIGFIELEQKLAQAKHLNHNELQLSSDKLSNETR